MNDPSRPNARRFLVLAALAVVALLLLLLVWTVRPVAPASDEAEVEAQATPGVARPADASLAHAGPPDVVLSERAASSVTRREDVAVRGRVVDGRRNEPVPELEVRLRSGDPELDPDSHGVEGRTTTRADGSFESVGPYDFDTLTVALYDQGERIRLRWDAPRPRADVTWELDVLIGPTVPVLIAVRDEEHVDPAQWTARIVESALPEDCAGEVHVHETGLRMLRPCEGCPDRVWPALALRPGTPPWIRYPSVLHEPDERRRPRLEVESLERVQRGRTRLRGTLGIQPPALVDPLERFVLVEGIVVDEHGEGVSHARVIALPHRTPGGEDERTPLWRTTTSDTLGRFTLRDVAPGRALVCAWVPARPAALATVHVVAGRSTIDEALTLRALRGPASGARTAEAEREKAAKARAAKNAGFRLGERTHRFLRLRLACTERFTNAWLVPIDVEPDSDEARALSLADLATGLPAESFEYAWIDRVERRRRPRTPRRPAHGEIVVPDHVELGGIAPGASLALDTQPAELKDAWISFEAGGALVGCERAAEVARMRLVLAPDAELDWAAWKRGFAPFFGRRADLALEDDTLVMRPRLAAGWGALVWFRVRDKKTALVRQVDERLAGLGYIDPSAGSENPPDPLAVALAAPPLSGVRVHADGKHAATSDVEGIARIAQESRPARLLLYAEGWHLAALERLEQDSAAPAVRYVAWMERD